MSPWLFTFHCVRVIEHSKLPRAVNRFAHMEKVLLLKRALKAHERLPVNGPHILRWRDGNYFSLFWRANGFKNGPVGPFNRHQSFCCQADGRCTPINHRQLKNELELRGEK